MSQEEWEQCCLSLMPQKNLTVFAERSSSNHAFKYLPKWKYYQLVSLKVLFIKHHILLYCSQSCFMHSHGNLNHQSFVMHWYAEANIQINTMQMYLLRYSKVAGQLVQPKHTSLLLSPCCRDNGCANHRQMIVFVILVMRVFLPSVICHSALALWFNKSWLITICCWLLRQWLPHSQFRDQP